MYKKRSIAVVLFVCLVFCSALFYAVPIANGVAEGLTIENTVFLGGIPIGIHATSKQFVVTEIVSVMTGDGAFSPALQAGVSVGDLICAVNGKEISDIVQFNNEIQSSDEVTLTVRRNGEDVYISVSPVFDVNQQVKKIGILIKNDISGMGTLTFVTKDGYFGALGHIISDGYGYGDIYSAGTIYECEVTGFNRPQENIPGELRGNVDFSEQIGVFNKNNIAGIYGTTKIDTTYFTEIEVANRNKVVAGKAQIVSTIDGNLPKLYDIEIVKANKQDSIADRSMVIRITDKYLKKTTGGILQGMSGSPIIQNGKLVGAVTHVFMNDPTKGYGIYAEWMMQNIG